MGELDNKAVDFRASLYKGIAGSIPFAGPLISEVISTIIPEQRIDRVASFLKLLDEKINKIEQESLKENKYFIDLFEDGLVQSSRAMTIQRNKYISVFLSKSINVNEINYTPKKKLLHVLEELTDQDVEVLIGIIKNGSQKTSMEYNALSISIGAYKKLTDEEKYEHDLKSSLWESHVNTLERFSLIVAEREKQDTEYAVENMSEHIDEETGLPRITGYSQTVLGKALINSIIIEKNT